MRKKSDIIAAIAENSGHSKKIVDDIINAQRDLAHQALKEDGEFQFHDVGILTLTERQARSGRNPQSGEPMEIPASKGVRFKVAKLLKRAINE